MKLPWHNKTGIPKAIAILATTAILAFGLCSAGLLTSVSDRPLPVGLIAFFAVCGNLAIVSFVVLLILFAINAYRSKR